MDGVPLQLGPVADRVWGADISPFAGKSVELRFEALPALSDPVDPQSFLFMDNIKFSTEPFFVVPEPAETTLLVVGGGALIALTLRRKTQARLREG